MTKTGKPKSVGEYISTSSDEAKPRLREMLAILREAAPGAKEELKWGQPAFSYDWILFAFAAFRSHISLALTPSAVKSLGKELDGFDHTMMAIKFPLDKPLPAKAILKFARYRVEEAKKGVRWMSKK